MIGKKFNQTKGTAGTVMSDDANLLTDSIEEEMTALGVSSTIDLKVVLASTTHNIAHLVNVGIGISNLVSDVDRNLENGDIITVRLTENLNNGVTILQNGIPFTFTSSTVKSGSEVKLRVVNNQMVTSARYLNGEGLNLDAISTHLSESENTIDNYIANPTIGSDEITMIEVYESLNDGIASEVDDLEEGSNRFALANTELPLYSGTISTNETLVNADKVGEFNALTSDMEAVLGRLSTILGESTLITKELDVRDIHANELLTRTNMETVELNVRYANVNNGLNAAKQSISILQDHLPSILSRLDELSGTDIVNDGYILNGRIWERTGMTSGEIVTLYNLGTSTLEEEDEIKIGSSSYELETDIILEVGKLYRMHLSPGAQLVDDVAYDAGGVTIWLSQLRIDNGHPEYPQHPSNSSTNELKYTLTQAMVINVGTTTFQMPDIQEEGWFDEDGIEQPGGFSQGPTFTYHATVARSYNVGDILIINRLSAYTNEILEPLVTPTQRTIILDRNLTVIEEHIAPDDGMVIVTDATKLGLYTGNSLDTNMVISPYSIFISNLTMILLTYQRSKYMLELYLSNLQAIPNYSSTAYVTWANARIAEHVTLVGYIQSDSLISEKLISTNSSFGDVIMDLTIEDVIEMGCGDITYDDGEEGNVLYSAVQVGAANLGDNINVVGAFTFKSSVNRDVTTIPKGYLDLNDQFKIFSAKPYTIAYGEPLVLKVVDVENKVFEVLLPVSVCFNYTTTVENEILDNMTTLEDDININYQNLSQLESNGTSLDLMGSTLGQIRTSIATQAFTGLNYTYDNAIVDGINVLPDLTNIKIIDYSQYDDLSVLLSNEAIATITTKVTDDDELRTNVTDIEGDILEALALGSNDFPIYKGDLSVTKTGLELYDGFSGTAVPTHLYVGPKFSAVTVFGVNGVTILHPKLGRLTVDTSNISGITLYANTLFAYNGSTYTYYSSGIHTDLVELYIGNSGVGEVRLIGRIPVTYGDVDGGSLMGVSNGYLYVYDSEFKHLLFGKIRDNILETLYGEYDYQLTGVDSDKVTAIYIRELLDVGNGDKEILYIGHDKLYDRYGVLHPNGKLYNDVNLDKGIAYTEAYVLRTPTAYTSIGTSSKTWNMTSPISGVNIKSKIFTLPMSSENVITHTVGGYIMPVYGGTYRLVNLNAML